MRMNHTSSSLGKDIWRRLYQNFGNDLRVYRKRLSLSYLLSFLQVLTTLLLPWPLKIIIDHGLTGTALPHWLDWMNAYGTEETLILIMVLVFILITLLYAVTGAGSKILEAKVREGLGLGIRDRLLSRLQDLPPILGTDERRGDLLHRLVSDVNTFAGFQTKTLPLIFRHGATVLLILITMFWLEPLLGMAGLCLLPLFGLSIWRYGTRLTHATKEKRTREGNVAGLAQEIVQGLSTTKGLGHEQLTREQFGVMNAESLKAGVLASRTAVAMERALQIGQGIAIALITGGGAFLVLRGRLTLGELTVFVSYMTQLLKPVEKINVLASTFSRGVVSGDRLLSLLDRMSPIHDHPNAITIQQVIGIAELTKVSFRYPSTHDQDSAWILDGVTMRLEPGRLAVLIGESGSGKSTLLSLLARFFDPTKGDITLDGYLYSQIALQSLRSHVTLMIQDIHLFAGTVRSVLTPPPFSGVPDEQIWNTLKLVHLDRFVKAQQHGLDTSLSENGINWSGGQRRRLSLARAILLDRPILLLDEPLAHVDKESEAVILQALDHIRQNRTCLVSSHSSLLIERADDVFYLKHGRITHARHTPTQTFIDSVPQQR